MKHGVLAEQLATEFHEVFEGMDFTKIIIRTTDGDIEGIVVVAEGQTATELLPLIENFEAQLSDKS